MPSWSSAIFLREAEMDFPWDCLIFHDVDLLPLNDTNPYSCSKAQYYHALRLLSSLAVNLIIRTFFFISIRTLFWWPPGKTNGNGSCHMQTILEELLQYPSSNTSRSSTSRFPCCVLSYFAHLSRPWSIALWNKSNGSYDIKEFGTLPLIFSTSKYFRWKFQPWPSFFPHANIPDTWKRGQLSLEQMKKMEKVKVKSHLRYLAACSVQKKRWDIWRIFFSDFRSVFSP